MMSKKVLLNFNITMSQKLKSEVSEMCHLSKGLIEEGIAQGIVQGKLMGIAESQLESIKNIMETLGLTAKQAMEALRID